MPRISSSNKQEQMKTNIKVLKVCQGTVGLMILKLNNHDMIMHHSEKLVLISMDKFPSSQNEWNDQNF